MIRWLLLITVLALPARADEQPPKDDEPPTPAQLALRIALPAVGVTFPFNASKLEAPGAMLAWPLQYPLDDLLLPRFRVIAEPQVVYPSPQTFPLRVRLGLRYVPWLRGVVDESTRFFFGAGATLSSRISVSGEIGLRIPYKWPLWTFFVALRGDYFFTASAPVAVSLLGGFTLF